jgi:amino acid adenylation domain-containing protein
MSNQIETGLHPPSQELTADRRLVPTNRFIEFRKEEIEQSIHDRFEQMVRKYPDRIAVKTRNYTLTYDALNKMANRVAWAVWGSQSDGNEPVAMLMESDAPMIAASIGVLKAGKICVPINPSHPDARISQILKDSEATLILVNDKNVAVAKKVVHDECQVVNIDDLDSRLSDKNLGLSHSADLLAFILYTSGSTAEPKGVMHNHRNMLHVIMRWTNDFGICPDDRLSFLGPPRRDVFRALLNGAAVYALDLKAEGLARMPHWLLENSVTIFHSVPTPFRHFVDILTGKEEFPALRLIILLGEPLYPRDVELFRKHFSPTSILVNSLGSSEAHSFSYYHIDKEVQITERIVPVGRTVADTEVLLFDDAGERIGFNQVGEIAVKSRYLSPGYWKKPDLTRAAFQPDPNSGKDILYFTGDLGLMRPDGCLVYVGRKDFQVKIRGHRVEMAEVESTLLDHHGIKEVAVAASENPTGDKRLVAYFVASKRLVPTVGELRTFLKEKLPDYMIPSAFVSLDKIPLTATGKVDRRALPDPGSARPELDTLYVPPRTPVEKEVAKIWAEILSLDLVGIHDNFLDLGGHSLAATRIVSRLINAFRLELSAQSLAQAPTVAEMAALILQAKVKEVGQEDLASVLNELEAISDQEAQDSLNKEYGKQV